MRIDFVIQLFDFKRTAAAALIDCSTYYKLILLSNIAPSISPVSIYHQLGDIMKATRGSIRSEV